MNSKNIHVVKHGDGWAARREGAQRVSSTHPTQETARLAARDMAIRDKGEVHIHRPNGQIRDRDSYGNDPFPPRG